MIRYCSRCGIRLFNGDKVRITVLTEYVDIPSEKSFAVKPPEDYVVDTLAHTDCGSEGYVG